MTHSRFDMGMDSENKGAQRQMWDRWRYDRFEIPHTIPADARRLALEMGGETFGAVLLDHVAPKTCKAFWDILPYTGNMIHCAWFGHAAFYLDRLPMLDGSVTNSKTASSGLHQEISSGTRSSKR